MLVYISIREYLCGSRGTCHQRRCIKMQQSLAQMETSIRKQKQKPKSVLTFLHEQEHFQLDKEILFLTFSKALSERQNQFYVFLIAEAVFVQGQ